MSCGRTQRCIESLAGAAFVSLLMVFVLCGSAGEVQAKDERRAKPRLSDVAVSADDASSSGFTHEEEALLLRGKSVKRGFQLKHAGSQYQAGLSYRLVQATPMDVIRTLRRPGGLVQVMPYGLSANVLSEKDGVSWITISQGKRPIVGRYTVRMEWDLNSYQARFWRDPAYKADLEDIWGVFSAREIRPGFTLITFGFAFKLGGVASMLEGKAQTWGLTTADRIAEQVIKAAPAQEPHP